MWPEGRLDQISFSETKLFPVWGIKELERTLDFVFVLSHHSPCLATQQNMGSVFLTELGPQCQMPRPQCSGSKRWPRASGEHC